MRTLTIKKNDRSIIVRQKQMENYDYSDNNDVVILPKVGSRRQKVLCLVGTAIAGLAIIDLIKLLRHQF